MWFMGVWSECEPRGTDVVVDQICRALPDALRQSDLLREKQKSWPPDNRRHDPSGRGLASVMDDEMGFVD